MDSEIQQMQQELARWIQLSWESVGRDGRAPADFIWPDALEWVKQKALSLVRPTREQFGWYPSPHSLDRSTSRSPSPPLRKRRPPPPLDSQWEQIAKRRRDDKSGHTHIAEEHSTRLTANKRKPGHAHIAEEHSTRLSAIKRKREVTPPSVEECIPSSKRNCRRLIVVLPVKSGKCALDDSQRAATRSTVHMEESQSAASSANQLPAHGVPRAPVTFGNCIKPNGLRPMASATDSRRSRSRPLVPAMSSESDLQALCTVEEDCLDQHSRIEKWLKSQEQWMKLWSGNEETALHCEITKE